MTPRPGIGNRDPGPHTPDGRWSNVRWWQNGRTAIVEMQIAVEMLEPLLDGIACRRLRFDDQDGELVLVVET